MQGQEQSKKQFPGFSFSANCVRGYCPDSKARYVDRTWQPVWPGSSYGVSQGRQTTQKNYLKLLIDIYHSKISSLYFLPIIVYLEFENSQLLWDTLLTVDMIRDMAASNRIECHQGSKEQEINFITRRRHSLSVLNFFMISSFLNHLSHC